jgi:dihydrofolate reductase
LTAEYLLTDFSQATTEVLRILWVVFLDNFIPGCLIKKLFGNIWALKVEKKMALTENYIRETIARTGAFIMGKRMFEEGEVSWPNDLYKADVYVLTHEKREPWVQEGTTTFLLHK